MKPLGFRFGYGLVKQGSKLNPFKITVDTTKAGSASDTFVLPLDGTSTYDFRIFWGDGTSETVTTNTNVTHTYASAGTYQISIEGTFPHIHFNNVGDKLKLISIDAWGSIKWQSMDRAFYGCENMDGTYKDSPNFSNVNNMDYMFRGCSSFNQPVSNFDTSNVENMNSMFLGCSFFKQDISGFSIESVTDLKNMLNGCNINETGTTDNYDDLLVSFESQAGTYSKTGLDFHGGTSKYSETGEAARDSLTLATGSGGYGWTITDSGLAT